MKIVNIVKNATILAGLVFALMHCADESTTKPTQNVLPTGSIWPIKVGLKWVCLKTVFDTSGNVYSAYNDTNTFTRDTIIDNQTWYFWNGNKMWTTKDDGVYQYNFRDHPYFKYPTNIGDTSIWSWDSTDVHKSITMSTYSIVNVPAGQFACCAYKVIHPTVCENMFLSPSTGLISYEYNRLIDGVEKKWMKLELIKILE